MQALVNKVYSWRYFKPEKAGNFTNFAKLLKLAGLASPVAGGLISLFGEISSDIGRYFDQKDLLKLSELCQSPKQMDEIAKAVASFLVQQPGNHDVVQAKLHMKNMIKGIFKGQIKPDQKNDKQIVVILASAALGRKVEESEILTADHEVNHDNQAVASNAVPQQFNVEETGALKEVAAKHIQEKEIEEKAEDIQKGNMPEDPKITAAKEITIRSLKTAINEVGKNTDNVTPSHILRKMNSMQQLTDQELKTTKAEQIRDASAIAFQVITKIENTITLEDQVYSHLIDAMDAQIKVSYDLRKLLINKGPLKAPRDFAKSLGEEIAALKNPSLDSVTGAMEKWAKAEIERASSAQKSHKTGLTHDPF